MKKQVGRDWFDTQKAQEWQFPVGDSTSAMSHTLWRTESGRFVEERMDRSFGHSIAVIDIKQAAALMTRNGYGIPDDWSLPGNEL